MPQDENRSPVMDEHQIETYKSMLNIGAEATKALVLLNGGAVVAVLAYLGQVSDRAAVAARCRWPTGAFVAGLALAMLSYLPGYMTQYTLFNEGLGEPLKWHHMTWLKITIAVLVLSLILFSAGAFLAISALG